MAEDKQHGMPKMKADDGCKLPDGSIKGGVQRSAQQHSMPKMKADDGRKSSDGSVKGGVQPLAQQHSVPNMQADDGRKSSDGSVKGEGVQRLAQPMKSKNVSTRKSSSGPHLSGSRNQPIKKETSSEHPNAPSHLLTPDVSNVEHDQTLLSAVHGASTQTEASFDGLQHQSPSALPNLRAGDQYESVETNHGSPTTDANSMLSPSPASGPRRSRRTRTASASVSATRHPRRARTSSDSGRTRLERELESYLDDAPVRTRPPSIPALNFDDEHGRVRMTRNTKKNIQLLTENKPLSPPPDMNLKRLTYNQFSDVRDRKVFDNVGIQGKDSAGNDEDGDASDSEAPYQPRTRRLRDKGNTTDDLDPFSKKFLQSSRPMRGSKLRAMQNIREMAADLHRTTGSRIAKFGTRSASTRGVAMLKHRSHSLSSDGSGWMTRGEARRSVSPEGAPPSDGLQSENPQHSDMLSSTNRAAVSGAESTDNINHETEELQNENDNGLVSLKNASQTPKLVSKEKPYHQSETKSVNDTFESPAGQATQLGHVDRAVSEEQESQKKSKAHKRQPATPVARPQKKARRAPTI